MVYRVIGVYGSMPHVAIVFAEFLENAGNWSYELKEKLIVAAETSELGDLINQFVEERNLHYQLALITVHVDFSNEEINGANIAAKTRLPVISDLPGVDKALGGNGDFFKCISEKLKTDIKGMNDESKALCVAFMGVLRWREEYNFLSSFTGASRNSIGGAIWMGQDA